MFPPPVSFQRKIIVIRDPPGIINSSDYSSGGNSSGSTGIIGRSSRGGNSGSLGSMVRSSIGSGSGSCSSITKPYYSKINRTHFIFEFRREAPDLFLGVFDFLKKSDREGAGEKNEKSVTIFSIKKCKNHFSFNLFFEKHVFGKR